MYMQTYTHICIHTYAHLHTCTHVRQGCLANHHRAHQEEHLSPWIAPSLRPHVCLHPRVCGDKRAHTHTHAPTHTHTYAYAHTPILFVNKCIVHACSCTYTRIHIHFQSMWQYSCTLHTHMHVNACTHSLWR